MVSENTSRTQRVAVAFAVLAIYIVLGFGLWENLLLIFFIALPFILGAAIDRHYAKVDSRASSWVSVLESHSATNSQQSQAADAQLIQPVQKVSVTQSAVSEADASVLETKVVEEDYYMVPRSSGATFRSEQSFKTRLAEQDAFYCLAECCKTTSLLAKAESPQLASPSVYEQDFGIKAIEDAVQEPSHNSAIFFTTKSRSDTSFDLIDLSDWDAQYSVIRGPTGPSIERDTARPSQQLAQDTANQLETPTNGPVNDGKVSRVVKEVAVDQSFVAQGPLTAAEVCERLKAGQTTESLGLDFRLTEDDYAEVMRMDHGQLLGVSQLIITILSPLPEQFREVAPLGKGTYGTLFPYRDPVTGSERVAKLLSYPWSQGCPQTLEEWLNCAMESLFAFGKETDMMLRLNDKFDEHPNIVTYFTTEYESTRDCGGFPQTWLVLERAAETLEYSQVQGRSAQLSLLRDLMSALLRTRNRRIVHNDIKPSNILRFEARQTQVEDVHGLDRERDVYKLADFGIAGEEKEFVEPCTEMIGTQSYAAPEVMTEVRCGYAADMYGAYASWMEGRGLWRPEPAEVSEWLDAGTLHTRHYQALFRATENDPEFGDNFADMMAWDPKKRPTPFEVKRRIDAILTEDVLASQQPRVREWTFLDDISL